MSVQVITAEQAMARWGHFSAIIDARSEAEFALDHLPGARNWPTLDDDQRRTVGTLYKNVHPFEASKVGAVMAARNIARHIEHHLADTPKHWRPLVYCWRGGKRSGSLALVLGQIGFQVATIEGGYKAFRTQVLVQLPQLAQRLTYRVVCGPTGSGKTRLLAALRRAAAQVLDLEDLARHRSSVLGSLPGVDQPSQKRFETLLWDQLRQFDPTRPVFVESESRKVGNLAVPAELIAAMRASPCVDLQMPQRERVHLLLEDYPHFAQDAELFNDRLATLTELRGKALVQSWIAAVSGGHYESVVQALLALHYDPGYENSMQRNFSQYPQRTVFEVRNRSCETLERLALTLRQQFDTLVPTALSQA